MLTRSRISCKANGWAQNAFGILGIAAFSGVSKPLRRPLCRELSYSRFLAFSALRAYALSNKNRWLTTMIVLLALPAPAVEIVSVKGNCGFRLFNHFPTQYLAINIEFQNLPSPFYCIGSSRLSPTIYNMCVSSPVFWSSVH